MSWAAPTTEQYHAGDYVLLIAEHLETGELEGARYHVADRREADIAAVQWFATHDEHAIQASYRRDRITRSSLGLPEILR